jgi:molecular chaperone DnaJ
MNKNYYNILGVNKESTDKDIKKAYRTLSKKYHPDVNPDSPESEEKFKEIADAYSVLSNKEKRENFDAYGNPDGQPNPFGRSSGMDDIFSSFFGGGNPFNGQNRKQAKGSDIRVSIKLTIGEIFEGTHKKIKYKRKVSCSTCNSTGGKSIMCGGCGGKGIVMQVHNTPLGRIQRSVICPRCGGNGNNIVDPCKNCNGQATVTKEEVLEFDVPTGISDGEVLLVKDKGNSTKGGKDGDLIINITEVPHEKFHRNGLDIHQRIKISYKDLVLGSPTEIETLGGKIRLNIKSGTQVGHILRVPNKGLKRGNQLGDMMIEVWLDIPKEITEENKKLIESLNI